MILKSVGASVSEADLRFRQPEEEEETEDEDPIIAKLKRLLPPKAAGVSPSTVKAKL